MAKVKSKQINQVKFKMIYCPSGSFEMGSDEGNENESPKHPVKLNHGFWLSETQVTQALWETVMGYNPSQSGDNVNLPVEMVTWYESLLFCNRLSMLDGLTPCFAFYDIEFNDDGKIIMANVEWNQNANGYRLPTEAQWEYAAKAGTTLKYSGSDDLEEVAWCEYNSDELTHPVKTKKPNAWGLYDMSGNVWEWCMDPFDLERYESRGTESATEDPTVWIDEPCRRVLRGGSCWYMADDCRVSVRFAMDPEAELCVIGLRLLRSDT
jgi:sulfatase modifying factor 1